MLTPTTALHWGRKITRNKLRRRIFFLLWEGIVNAREDTSAACINIHCTWITVKLTRKNKIKLLLVDNDWNLTEIQSSYLITEMFIQPKTNWNMKKNYYSNGNQIKRENYKGNLEIFLFMQVTNFLADLCCILAVFKYKYLKIAAT